MFNRTGHHGPRRFKMFFPLMMLPLLFMISATVQFLWNAVLPALLHVSAISYWQAMGLLVLCRILFGNYHFRGRGSARFMESTKQMRDKWMSMNDEERIRFKQEWRERCHGRRP